jgi:hypothetical protein
MNMMEYYGLMYENGETRLVLRMGGEGIKQKDRGENFTMMYYKHFCKCHNVPLVKQ